MWVTAVFGGAIILTMLGIVLASLWGFNMIPMEKIERNSHALADGAIYLCGLAIQLLGW